MARLNFNRKNAPEGSSSFDLIPDGWYMAEIVNSEMKQTKKGDGSYISLRFKLDGNPKFDGRQLFCNLNIDNPNEKAVEIAQRQLGEIMDCCGIQEVNDSEELHGKPMLIKVRTRKGSGDYDDQNEIKGFKPANGSVPSAAATSASGGGNKPSWATKAS
jgi:hypothetical protein